MRSILIIIAIGLFTPLCKAQDSLHVFENIAKALKEYKIDTSDAPADKITAKIEELRSLKAGFKINEAIEFKIGEEMQKNETPKEDLIKLSESFKNGTGKKWLDNAVTWIYRQHFSYRELKQLVNFYKTAAGQKMAKAFPIIMLKSLAAGETIQKILTKK